MHGNKLKWKLIFSLLRSASERAGIVHINGQFNSTPLNIVIVTSAFNGMVRYELRNSICLTRKRNKKNKMSFVARK